MVELVGRPPATLSSANFRISSREDPLRSGWKWITDQFETFLRGSHGAYPARTTGQLTDFLDTIRSELTMTQYQETQREKAQLYCDHYDEITEVKQAFENRWERLSTNWGK